ncbi:MAG: flippase-like domain-containing protein [Chloroflexi bacterium]|nr:flippase-like domain-containing protein [Chloroflexota bacterium]
MNTRRVITFILSIAITALFLWLALAPVDFPKLALTFATADYRFVFAAALAMLCGYLLRAARWQKFLAPTKPISLRRLFPILIVGFGFNNLLPARPGEVARAYWLGQREGISRTLCLATVIVERVVDGLTLIGFLLIALASFERLGLDLPPLAEAIVVAMTALFGIALIGLIFLLVRESLARALLKKITRLMPHRFAARIEKMLGSFVTGLHALKSASDIAAIAFFSIAIWTLESATYFLMLIAFDAIADAPLRAVASVMTMVMINFGVMIPAAPGGLGPYEAAGIFALGALRVDETTAASIALGTHAIQYLMITGLGLFFIWREGMKLATSDEESASDA